MVPTMLPDRYRGVWRRDWIERRSTGERAPLRDTSPAIWFQSMRSHVDLRVDPTLFGLPSSAFPARPTQTAFAGNTTVEMQDGKEQCQWHPSIAYPGLSDEVDSGYMEFPSADHVIETGIDGSYVESWCRIHDGETLRCFRFASMTDSAQQCYLMLGRSLFAIGSNVASAEVPHVPVYAWGESTATPNQWRVRESLTPCWIGREFEIDPRIAELSSLPPASRAWCLPILPGKDWRLIAVE